MSDKYFVRLTSMHGLNHRPTVVVALVLPVLSVVLGLVSDRKVFGEYSAQEILDRSQSVMSPPIEYRVDTNGNEMMVYQKLLPDDTLVTRIETVSPVKTIQLQVGDKQFQVFPDHNLIIDSSFMLQSAKDFVDPSAIGQLAGGNEAELKGIVNRNNKECYEVELTLPAVTALLKNVPPLASDKVPAKIRSVIEKDTFNLFEREILSSTNTSLTLMTYSDISKTVTLEDDFFLPPKGLKTEKPESISEYISLRRQMRPSREELLAQGKAEGRERAKLLMPSRPADKPPRPIDPHTGRPIVRNIEELKRINADSEPASGELTAIRKTGICVTVLLIGLLVTAIVYRRRFNAAG